MDGPIMLTASPPRPSASTTEHGTASASDCQTQLASVLLLQFRKLAGSTWSARAGNKHHQGERMKMQKLLPGVALSALLAMTAPGNAAENAVQKEGNAMEAKGNAQEKKAVHEKKAAEHEKATGEAKKAKGEQTQKDAEELKKHEGSAAEGARRDRAGAAEKAKGEKMEQAAKAHMEHAKKTQKAADVMEKSGNKVEKAGTAIDKK
jgi:hypothetical protein